MQQAGDRTRGEQPGRQTRSAACTGQTDPRIDCESDPCNASPGAARHRGGLAGRASRVAPPKQPANAQREEPQRARAAAGTSTATDLCQQAVAPPPHHPRVQTARRNCAGPAGPGRPATQRPAPPAPELPKPTCATQRQQGGHGSVPPAPPGPPEQQQRPGQATPGRPQQGEAVEAPRVPPPRPEAHQAPTPAGPPSGRPNQRRSVPRPPADGEPRKHGAATGKNASSQ